MGQAVVDLPDPLEKQPAGASSADDLLAQLAGDEIDRMLTEANVEPAAAAEDEPVAHREAIATPADDSLNKAADSTTAAAVDDLLAGLDEPKAETATEQAVAAPAEKFDPSDIDQLLDSAIAPTADAVAGEPAAKVDIDQTLAAEADAKLAPHTAAVQAEAAAEIAHAEAAAIAAPSTLVPAVRAEEPLPDEAAEREGLLATVAGEATDDDLSAPLPIWLRPLEWISDPLDAFSDDARSFLGKAAILTLVNSAAVIAYVLMFRRH